MLIGSAALQAASVDLRYYKVDPRSTATVRFAPSPFHNRTVYIGKYQSRIRNPETGTEAEQVFADYGVPTDATLTLPSWCVDIHQHANGSWQRYELVDVALAPIVGAGDEAMGPGKALQLSNLFVQYSALVESADDSVHAAAFQAAIWEIVSETPGEAYNVSTGDFRLDGSSSWKTLANTWLDGLSSQPDVGLGLRVFAHPGSQDFAFYVPTDPPQEIVPEPLTMLAVGSAVVGLGGYLRRRRNG